MSMPTLIVQVWQGTSVIDRIYPRSLESAAEHMRDVWGYKPSATRVSLHPLTGDRLEIGPALHWQDRPSDGPPPEERIRNLAEIVIRDCTDNDARELAEAVLAYLALKPQ